MELNKNERELGVGASVVLALMKSIKNPASCIVFCDNYFSSIKLFLYLENSLSISANGTFRSNRIEKWPLLTDKELLKQGRGSVDFRTHDNKIILLKYADNKCVIMGSTIYGVEPKTTLLRWCKEQKKKVKINCPNLVFQYNKNMVGVDKNNCLVSLYRTLSKSRRWYLPIFFYLLDMSIVNAWLLYKKETIKHRQLQLKEFRLEVAEGLLQDGKRKRGRQSEILVNKRINAPRCQRPYDLIRYDGVGHWPTFKSERLRCKYCNSGESKIVCSKCNVALCQNVKK